MPNLATPGVYIVELPATGPIAGVGTSTPAFLGVALNGPTAQPVQITNWTEFASQFGGYLSGRFLANAVRGFYDNGGTVAYIVRVGTAAPAALDLGDRAATGPTLHVQAKSASAITNGYWVTVVDSNKVNSAKLAKASAALLNPVNANATVVTLANGADTAKFQPGDFITINDSANEHAQISRIRSPQLFLATGLVGSYAAAAVLRIADLQQQQTSFRVANGAGLETGSVISINSKEDRVVNGAVPFGDGSVGLTLATGLSNAYSLKITDPDITISSYEFDLTVSDGTTPEPANKFLSMDPRHSRYFVNAVKSSLVTVSPPVPPSTPSAAPPPGNLPKAVAQSKLAGGADDTGNPSITQYQTALTALEALSDVNVVCAPDAAQMADVQGAVRDHCEQLGDRFAILDARPDATADLSQNSILSQQRANVQSQRGYAGLYFPWIMISDPLSKTDGIIFVPPSGHIAGVYARSDDQRGVHKAPANEPVRGALGLSTVLNDGTQGVLNLAGIDVLRVFPGATRPIVWGARTTAPVGEVAFLYVSVRRLFLFIEQSIKAGIRWAVFEPNDLTLWKKLDRTITEFLTRVWRAGALFGATAKEAFYVKIDEENNPEALRALGQIHIEIGLAPVRPAEFVIVQIGLWAGGSTVAEG
jgi:phage tail sheath protein FI